MWNEIRDLIGATDDYLWHVHPERFRHYANENLVHDFNPYNEKGFSQLTRRWIPSQPSGASRELVPRPVIVRDNPGFAPAWENQQAADDSRRRRGATAACDRFEANGSIYTHVTGIFNQEYFGLDPQRIYHHEGIDFRGNNGTTPIHALIHAKVVFIGDRGSYGRHILFQSITNPNHFYMIAHLNRENTVPSIVNSSVVYPGKPVAYVGTSGGVPSHLHVSFFIADRLRDIHNGTHFVEGAILGREYNPFDHSEPYYSIR